VSSFPVASRRPLHFPHLAKSRCGSERPLGQALGAPWPAVVVDPPWTVPCASPQLVDRVHRISLYKINPHHFANTPMYLSKIKSQSTKFVNGTLESENISRFSPNHFPEIINRSLKFFSPYLYNRNFDFSDSRAKFLRITSSFLPCIYNTCLLHID
jgi:hypothetical protein